jgi:hypothetical protein
MPFARLMSWVRSRTGAADTTNAAQKANAEKALAMKQAADSETHIPPHRTASEGMRPANDPHLTGATRGSEGGFTPQLKRSKVARSGDAS